MAQFYCSETEHGRILVIQANSHRQAAASYRRKTGRSPLFVDCFTREGADVSKRAS
jgi:hypothetical protein